MPVTQDKKMYKINPAFRKDIIISVLILAICLFAGAVALPIESQDPAKILKLAWILGCFCAAIGFAINLKFTLKNLEIATNLLKSNPIVTKIKIHPRDRSIYAEVRPLGPIPFDHGKLLYIRSGITAIATMSITDDDEAMVYFSLSSDVVVIKVKEMLLWALRTEKHV